MESTTPQPPEIDFLPDRFREQSVKRRTHIWRYVVVGAIALLLVAASLGQQRTRKELAAQLQALASGHAVATARAAELESLRAELVIAEEQAALITYLQTRWPRSQILFALVESLPAEVTMERFTIQTPSGSEGGNRPTRGDRAQEPAKQRDLDLLREEFDSRNQTVEVHGRTSDVSALHDYLGRLDGNALFSNSQLVAMEREARAEIATTSFHARLTLQPTLGTPAPSGTVSANDVSLQARFGQ